MSTSVFPLKTPSVRTGTAVVRSVVVPSPRLPLSLRPQQYTFPAAIAHVIRSPAASCAGGAVVTFGEAPAGVAGSPPSPAKVVAANAAPSTRANRARELLFTPRSTDEAIVRYAQYSTFLWRGRRRVS